MEPRRATLVSAPLEKSESKDKLGITVRFTLSLTESNDKTYPEFSYTELLKNAIEERELDENDPFSKKDHEEDAKLVALAKSFESKYATKVGGKKKKRRQDRLQDLVDLGEGYDETDTFIDNSIAYDEMVPACLTTKHGGFYINTGSLDFRPLSDEESIDAGGKVVRKKKLRIASDSDSEVDGVKKCGPKRKKSKEDVDGAKKERKRLKKLSGNGDKIMRRKKLKEQIRLKDPPIGGGVEPSNAVGQPTAPSTTTATTTTTPVSGVSDDGSDDSCQSDTDPLMPCPADNLESIIDSVMSRISTEGTTMTTVASEETTCEEALPDSLPASLTVAVNNIKQAAKDTAEGKCKFFSPKVNAILLQIEKESRQLSCGTRVQLYAHLGGHLPCSKETLMKRAKKLRLGAQHDPMKDSIEQLREAVSQCMPRLLEKHQAECIAKAQANQDRLLEVRERSETAAASRELNNGGTTGGVGGSGDSDGEPSQDDGERMKRFVPPRKKFEWTVQLRTLLCDVMRQKMACVELGKLGAETPEEHLRAFLDSEIRPLWPQGWIQTRMLFKETRSIHRKWTIGHKQRKNAYVSKCAQLLPPGASETRTVPHAPSSATILNTSVLYGKDDTKPSSITTMVPVSSPTVSPTRSSVYVTPPAHISPTRPVSARVSPATPGNIRMASPPPNVPKLYENALLVSSNQEPVPNGGLDSMAGYFDAFKSFACQEGSDSGAGGTKSDQVSSALLGMLSAKQLSAAAREATQAAMENVQEQRNSSEKLQQLKMQQQQGVQQQLLKQEQQQKLQQQQQHSVHQQQQQHNQMQQQKQQPYKQQTQPQQQKQQQVSPSHAQLQLHQLQQQRQQRSEELVQQQLQLQLKNKQNTSPVEQEQQRKQQRQQRTTTNGGQELQQSQKLFENLQMMGMLSKEDVIKLTRNVQRPADVRTAVAPPAAGDVKPRASPVTSPVKTSSKSPASTTMTTQQKSSLSPTFGRDALSNLSMLSERRTTPDRKVSGVCDDSMLASQRNEKRQETSQQQETTRSPPFLSRQHSQPALTSPPAPHHHDSKSPLHRQMSSTLPEVGRPQVQKQPRPQQQSPQSQHLPQKPQQQLPQQPQQQMSQKHISPPQPSQQQLQQQKSTLQQQQHLPQQQHQQLQQQQQNMQQQRQKLQQQQLLQIQQQLQQQQQLSQLQLPASPPKPAAAPSFGQLTLEDVHEQLLASTQNFYATQPISSTTSSLPPWTTGGLSGYPDAYPRSLGHRIAPPPAPTFPHDIGLPPISPPCGSGGGATGSSLHFRSPSHLPPGSSSNVLGGTAKTHAPSPHDTHRLPGTRASPQSLYTPTLAGQQAAPPSLTYSYPFTDGQQRPHHY